MCIVPENSQVIALNDLVYIPIIGASTTSPIYLSYCDLPNNPLVNTMLSTVHEVYQRMAEVCGFSVEDSFVGRWVFDEVTGEWRSLA